MFKFTLSTVYARRFCRLLSHDSFGLAPSRLRSWRVGVSGAGGRFDRRRGSVRSAAPAETGRPAARSAGCWLGMSAPAGAAAVACSELSCGGGSVRYSCSASACRHRRLELRRFAALSPNGERKPSSTLRTGAVVSESAGRRKLGRAEAVGRIVVAIRRRRCESAYRRRAPLVSRGASSSNAA